jgi:nitrogen regulatory protein PII-like uncharacterized protein
MICKFTRANTPEVLEKSINKYLKDNYKLVSVTAPNDVYTAWLVKDDTLKKIIEHIKEKLNN